MAGNPLYRSNEGALIAKLEARVAALERRRPVSGHYEIKLFADDQAVTAGDGRFFFAIPFNLEQARLQYVNAYVTTVSSSGLVTVQIHNIGSTQDPADFDMLTVPITIDANEKDAETAATNWEIDMTDTEYAYPFLNHYVFYRQQLRIDIDSAGSGAMGLGIQLGFD